MYLLMLKDSVIQIQVNMYTPSADAVMSFVSDNYFDATEITLSADEPKVTLLFSRTMPENQQL